MSASTGKIKYPIMPKNTKMTLYTGFLMWVNILINELKQLQPISKVIVWNQWSIGRPQLQQNKP